MREEAADPAALSAGVGHEVGAGGAESLPGPLLTPRVLVHTSSPVSPAAGGQARRLHEVEELSVGIGLAGQVSSLPSVQLGYRKVSVQVTAAILLPLPTQFRLVLHWPRPAVWPREPRQHLLILTESRIRWSEVN